MVNAIRMAAAFVDGLPAQVLTPERSAGHEGYIHAHGVDAAVERTAVRLLLRDFRTEGLADQARIAESLAASSEPTSDQLGYYLTKLLPPSDFLRFGIIAINSNESPRRWG